MKKIILISIASTIYLKKKSHLSIVVGKNGSMLVKISKYARINSENLFNKKVYLKIFVKYDPKWKDSESFLKFIYLICRHQIFIL
jgi:GTP-binding protein Era